MRRTALALTATLAIFCGITASSAAAVGTADTAKVSVGFSVDQFVKKGNKLVANGRAVTTYTAADGTTQTAAQPFTAKVIGHGIRGMSATSKTCSILYLELDKLSLTLLGLNVNLDKVILTIDADPNGGALGSLFCKLAHTKVSVRSLQSQARHLTAAAHATGLSNPLTSGVGFAVPVVPMSNSATAICPVLDLVLGPLNLKLLGLIVNLNQVHLTITADPTGGALGTLFCGLAHA